jgi:hypothetical protein
LLPSYCPNLHPNFHLCNQLFSISEGEANAGVNDLGGISVGHELDTRRSGWRVGSAAEFLGLSEEEVAYVDLKLTLSENLRKRRQRKNLTQVELAKMLKSNHRGLPRGRRVIHPCLLTFSSNLFWPWERRKETLQE